MTEPKIKIENLKIKPNSKYTKYITIILYFYSCFLHNKTYNIKYKC